MTDRVVAARPPPHILVVGIGSPHGDDRIGWQVATDVAIRWNRHVEARPQRIAGSVETRCASTPSELLDWLPGPSRLDLIDACVGLGEHQRWIRQDVFSLPPPPTRSAAGHLLGLAQVFELARTLGRLPPEVTLWAVRGASFEPGQDMSPMARDAAAAVAERIVDSLVEVVEVGWDQRSAIPHCPNGLPERRPTTHDSGNSS